MDLTVICQGCLSQDRRLKPLEEFEKLFKAIFRHSFDVFKMVISSSDLLLCWECLQIMKNIDKFHTKVVEAQLTLNNHIKQYPNNNDIKALSTLTITQIPQNESINAEHLNEISMFRIEEQDCKEEVLDIPEISSEKKPKDEPLDVNIHKNLKDEMECHVSDYEHENLKDEMECHVSDYEHENLKDEMECHVSDYEPEYINDTTMLSNKEIKEEKKQDIPQPKKKTNQREKTVNKTSKPKVLSDLENYDKNDYETDFCSKKIWLKKNTHLLDIVPGSQCENMLERLTSEMDQPSSSGNSRKRKRLVLNAASNENTLSQWIEDELYNDFSDVDDEEVDPDFSLLSKHDSDSEQSENEEIQIESLTCTKCNEVCYNERDFTSHMKLHFQKYMCRFCADDYIYDEDDIIRHVRKKHTNSRIQCRVCKMRFISLKERREHFKECLSYKCNDCTEVFKSKQRIEAHCSKHMSYKCIDCNVPLKNINMYRAHKRMKHSKIKTEAAYCVECDIQFDSDILMRNHLKTSVKHVKVVPRSYPCSECSKVYAKASTRNYHYNKAHKGITKYYCQICDKYFLNNYKLRKHKQLTHDKIPRPKDKLCPHCGRGFSDKIILRNHIYTHTGEGPHVCSYCGAKYAQKYARNLHMKNKHKHGIKT